jgi:replication factor A1
LSIKCLRPESGPSSLERFRVILSDGNNYVQGILATQLNQKVSRNEVIPNSIIKIKDFTVNSVKMNVDPNADLKRKIIILLEFDVLSVQASKIGSPVMIEENQPQQRQPAMEYMPHVPPPLNPHGQSMDYQQQMSRAPQSGYPPNNNHISITPPVASKPAISLNPSPHHPVRQPNDYYLAPPPKDVSTWPIKSLNPYQNVWTIKALVQSKSDMKQWKNDRGNGKLFSCILVDESGEIKATAFNNEADKFFPLLEENKTYLISKAQIRMAKKQFSNINNDYEISFDAGTEIHPCTESIQLKGSGVNSLIRYHFIPISQLMECEKDSFVDILGIVKEVGELTSITAKSTGKPFAKRDLVVVDQSDTLVKITLWASHAEKFNNLLDVVAFKGVRVSDFNGRSLSSVSASTITVNPDIPEAQSLMRWFSGVGKNSTTSKSISTAGSGGLGKVEDRKFFSQIKSENLGDGEKPDYFSIKGQISMIRSTGNIWYTACPTEGCNKKVIEEGPNMWRCEKCDRSFSYCDYRYVLSMNVLDHTGGAWLSCFNDIGIEILGKKAQELHQMRENDNEPAVKAAFQEATFKTYLFKVRAKSESFNEDKKVRCNIMSIYPIDYVKEAHNVLRAIEQYKV